MVDLPDIMVDLPDTMVYLLDTIVDLPDTMQYGLRWLKSISQRWGPGSRWDYLLASYVTPTNGSNAFFNCLKNPNFKQIGKIQFSKGLFPIISKLGSFKISKNA